MIKYNVYFIPWDKILSKDPAYHKQWMLVFADNPGEAKEYGKKEGLVTEVSLL
tara:strand:+ start:142 stop:300 length:159 start_codon:yes stop_codon:yes gene_type:complete